MNSFKESITLPTFDSPCEITIVISGDSSFLTPIKNVLSAAIRDIAIPAINNYQAEKNIATVSKGGCSKC